VSADTLPYALLMLLLELATGSLAVVTLFDARRMVTAGYVQAGAMTAAPLLLLALLVAAALRGSPEIDGYVLRAERLPALRWLLGAAVAVALAYALASLAGRPRPRLALGAAAALLGLLAIGWLAAVVAAPAWSYAGVLASMVAAAAALGGALMAMTWGHWYLTNSGLPKEPLEQMALLLAGALALQLVLLPVALLAPARIEPLTESAFGVGLGANPALWLRVGVGLLFPLVLALLAWRAAAIRGMMSATGLLYIAVGAVFAGEVLARGLLFASGAPV
jgi:hypothetical protein